jgi:type II secretory pathway component PulK
MRARRGGYALVLVLWLLAVLAVSGTATMLSTSASADLASNYAARLVARHAAESGVVNARALIGGRGPTSALLNDLPSLLGSHSNLQLGEGRATVSLIDVNARLDLNLADETALAALLASLTDAVEARAVARALRQGAPYEGTAELGRVPGLRSELANLLAPLVTTDGDGTINRRTAPPAVLAAAHGELRDAPTRILIVSRGWRDGHPLSFEVQTLHAVEGRRLVPLRSRERDL